MADKTVITPQQRFKVLTKLFEAAGGRDGYRSSSGGQEKGHALSQAHRLGCQYTTATLSNAASKTSNVSINNKTRQLQIFILEEQIIICTFAPKITNDDTTSFPYILYRN